MRCGHCKASDVDIAHVRGHLATQAPAAAARTAGDPATAGMYRKDGEVYKVVPAVHGSGQLYAKRLDRSGHPPKYVIAPGMVRKLTQADRMPLAEAEAFGKITGICVRCAATLTDEVSVARGIGPVCATKV
jgi:hypothetical protein